MTSVSDTPYVYRAEFNLWEVRGSRALRRPLRRLGFRRLPFSATATLKRRRPLTFEEMARLATALRDLGIAFAVGREWSPSEVVQKLRDDGLFEGSFTEMAWTGQRWLTRTV